MILVDVFVKTKCSTNKSGLEKKILDTSGLVQKTDYNAKITEIECKILSISGLATNSALTATVNKIPDVSSLVKKKKQIIIQTLVKLKRKLLLMIMRNILLPQNLLI